MDKYLGSWRRPIHVWRFAGSWPSHCDPKRSQREVADEFSVPDSEGMVFEAACGCFCEHGGVPCAFGQRYGGIG